MSNLRLEASVKKAELNLASLVRRSGTSGGVTRPTGPLKIARGGRGMVISVLLAASCLTVAAAGSPPTNDPDLLGGEGTKAAMQTAGSAEAPAEPRDPPGPQEERLEPTDGYRWRGPPADQPDWRGLRRDAAYFLGYQFVAVAMLWLAPGSESGWTEEQKQNYDFDQWRQNVRNPVWDHDTFVINYVLHPYWGASYYTRARERGLDRSQSFWYSALLSAMWEYGAEALAEPVSIQDLIFTPVLGSLVGEYLFAPWRERIRAKEGDLDWSDKAILALTDPLGAINATVDRWFGVKTTVQLQPSFTHFSPATRDRLVASTPVLARRPAGEWRLQLRVDW